MPDLRDFDHLCTIHINIRKIHIRICIYDGVDLHSKQIESEKGSDGEIVSGMAVSDWMHFLRRGMPGVTHTSGKGLWSRLKLPLALVLSAGSVVAISSALAAGPKPEESATVSFRRLTQDQYRQSIADIFGTDIKVSGRLEPDPRRDGLVAIGVANASVGAAGFEQYDAAAREIAGQVTDPAHRESLIGCTPQVATGPDEACTRQFIERVGHLLYRRPLDQRESDRFVAMAGQIATAKGDYYAGLSTSLAAMLESVPFIFRVERAVEDGTGHRLDAFSMAARLSFLIWNAPPDDALLGAATRGELATAQGLGRQVDRMLASPRLEHGVRAFFTDMLALDDLDGLQKDPAIYPRFSNRLAADAREQTLRTIVDTLVRKGEDYRALFTTRRTFMSRSLGLLYGEPVTSVGGWEAREFAEGDPRAGLLAQPAFLMGHSHPGRSSPTLRGKAIRELLLCQPVPAPPPNVNFALVQNVKDPRFATARQRLSAHNTEPMCAGCHKMMDPLGLPLESFDGSGAMRMQENGTPLDLDGTLGTASFTGAQGLGLTLSRDPALSSCLVGRLYSYGAGRALGEDLPWLEEIRTRHEAAGLHIRDLIRAIALDDAFYRLPPATAPGAVTRTDESRETPRGS